MTEPARAVPSAPAPRGGNFLTRKAGPLPMWGWLAIGGAGGLAFIWFRNRQKANAASAAAATTTVPATAAAPSGNADEAPEIATLQAEIQQLQGALSTEMKDERVDERADKKEDRDRDKDNDKRKCPRGYYYAASFPRGLPRPEGARKREDGGWCVPNRDKRLPQPGG